MRDSSKCNKAEIHYDCQGITFPNSEPGCKWEHTIHSKAVCDLQVLTWMEIDLWKAALNAADGCFPLPALQRTLYLLLPSMMPRVILPKMQIRHFLVSLVIKQKGTFCPPQMCSLVEEVPACICAYESSLAFLHVYLSHLFGQRNYRIERKLIAQHPVSFLFWINPFLSLGLN